MTLGAVAAAMWGCAGLGWRQLARAQASPGLKALARTYNSLQLQGGGPSRILIVHHRSQAQAMLDEMRGLIRTATDGERPQHVGTVVVGRQSERNLKEGAALREGHLARIRAAVRDDDVTNVVLNFTASGSQLSRISGELETARRDDARVNVQDRTALVLSIFRRHATTAEAKLQVQLADLRYFSSRLVRRRDARGRSVFGIAGQEAEVVSARGSGAQGTVGGGGDTEMAQQAYRARAKIAKVQRQLRDVQKQRQLLRHGRQRDGHRAVALVGYTNAGKSSLMAALCGEDVGAADRLFATLDTKVRRPHWHGSDVLLVDTIGFIQGLPLELVSAFQATLDEALCANVLVHVIDASSPAALQQRATVIHTLQQLGLSEDQISHRMIEVWNKVDVLAERVNAQACAKGYHTDADCSSHATPARVEALQPDSTAPVSHSAAASGFGPADGRSAQAESVHEHACEPGAMPWCDNENEIRAQLGNAAVERLAPLLGPAAAVLQRGTGECPSGLGGDCRKEEQDGAAASQRARSVIVLSALKGWGLDALRECVEQRLALTSMDIQVRE